MSIKCLSTILKPYLSVLQKAEADLNICMVVSSEQ